jgi:hypothetical protein
MNRDAAVERSCSECTSLKNGTRTNSEPHEYLLLAGSSGPETTSFRCLLCKSDLKRHMSGVLTRWT